jgi:uncharacterized membrane protein
MKNLQSLVGSLTSLVLVGILVWGLIKHNIKTMLGLMLLCCIIAAISVQPSYLIEIGKGLLDFLLEVVFNG